MVCVFMMPYDNDRMSRPCQRTSSRLHKPKHFIEKSRREFPGVSILKSCIDADWLDERECVRPGLGKACCGICHEDRLLELSVADDATRLLRG